MLSEKQIQNNILNFLNEIGLFCWQNDSIGVYDQAKKIYRKNRNIHHINGVADILGILPDGRILAIEVKTIKGRPSEEQLRFLTNIQNSKGIAFISRSVTQTYNQLILFYPGLEKIKHIADKWKRIEDHIEKSLN